MSPTAVVPTSETNNLNDLKRPIDAENSVPQKNENDAPGEDVEGEDDDGEEDAVGEGAGTGG